MIVKIKYNDKVKERIKRVSPSRNIHNAMRSMLRRFAKPFLKWLRDNMAYATGTASRSTIQSISMDRSRYWVRFHPRPIRKPRTEKRRVLSFEDNVVWYWYKAVQYYGVKDELEQLWQTKGAPVFYRWVRDIIKQWGDVLDKEGFPTLKELAYEEVRLPDRPNKNEYRQDKFKIRVIHGGKKKKLEKFLSELSVRQRQRFLYRIRKRVRRASELVKSGKKVNRVITIDVD